MITDVVVNLTSPPTVDLNITGNQLGLHLDQANSLSISLTNVEDVGQTIAVNTDDVHVVLNDPGGSVIFDAELGPVFEQRLGPVLKGDRGPRGFPGLNSVPEYTQDPAEPGEGMAWVLRTLENPAGTLQAIIGGFLAVTATDDNKFEFSINTSEGPKRVLIQ